MDSPFAAGVMVADPGGRLLFVKRSKDKTWAWPGGKIEEGETPEQAARRETQEETGLLAGDLTQIDEGMGFVTFRHEVAASFTPKLDHEHTEHQWAPIAAAPRPLHPGVEATLKKLAPGAVPALDTIGGGKETEGFDQNADKAQELADRSQATATAPAILVHSIDPELREAAALDRREYDDNNWFEVFDNPLSKVGVYQYSEASIKKGGDRSKMIGVFRPPEELGSEECIKSFRLMPWTDDHPRDLLGDPNQGYVPADEKGVKGVIGEQVYFKDGTLYGNLKVFSEALARKIAGGKRQLSCGYHCDFVPCEGVYEGVPYQYVQKNMRGNHVASVAAGRMGSEVRVLDAAESLSFAFDMKEIPMTACADCGRTHAASEDCMDAETQKFVADSFNSLVGELERKGYSKEYATKVAGKVAAEKGATGHDSTETGATTMPKAKDAEIKDPEGKEDPSKKKDLMGGPGSTKDSMTEEEEAGMDAAEEAKDAEEEEKEKDDESKEARDRRRARDRRAGARDARRMARDKRAKDAKDAKDKEEKDEKKGMDSVKVSLDAAEVVELVKRTVGKVPTVEEIITQVRPAIRKEEAAKSALYGRLSPLTGAFDHAEMTHVEMATYGLKKLGAPATTADPVTALDFYLAGRTQAIAPRSAALDTATGESFLDRYLATG